MFNKFLTKQRIADLVLISVAIAWGYSYIGVKVLQENGFDNFATVATRFVLGSILIGVIAFKSIIKSNKLEIIGGCTIGVFLFLAAYFQNSSFVYTSVGKSTFLSSLNLAIVPFLAFFINKTRISRSNIIGLIIAVCGVIVMSFNGRELFSSFNVGDILALLAAFGFAMQFVLLTRYTNKNARAINLAFWQVMSTGILALGAFIINGGNIVDVNINLSVVWSVFAIVFFATAYGYIAQFKAGRHTNEINMSIILGSAAIFGTIFDVLIYQTELSINQIIGSCLIMLAIIYLSITKNIDNNTQSQLELSRQNS